MASQPFWYIYLYLPEQEDQVELKVAKQPTQTDQLPRAFQAVKVNTDNIMVTINNLQVENSLLFSKPMIHILKRIYYNFILQREMCKNQKYIKLPDLLMT